MNGTERAIVYVVCPSSFIPFYLDSLLSLMEKGMMLGGNRDYFRWRVG